MRILHITDLHFGWGDSPSAAQEAWNRMAEELLQIQNALEQRVGGTETGGAFDMAAITGDLVMHGSESEYLQAEKNIHMLQAQLGLSDAQVVFCQGNHDADGPEAGAAFCAYEKFLKRFYAGQVPGSMTRPGVVAGRPVYSLNSNKKTSLEKFNDCWLDPNDVDRILAAAAREKKRGILLMHHQPELFAEQSQIERLSPAVCCILSGHLHSGYTRLYDWKGMRVVNGLAMQAHLPFLPTGFQIVEIAEDDRVSAAMHVHTTTSDIAEPESFFGYRAYKA